MKKFASTRSLNKILQQCDSSSREYEEIQAVEKKWHLHLATPRKFLDKKCKMPSLFLSAPPPPKRAPSTTLTLRSKSMTAELEELGEQRGRGGGGGIRPWCSWCWLGGGWGRVEPFQIVGMGQRGPGGLRPRAQAACRAAPLPAPVCCARSEPQHGWAGGDLTAHRATAWLGWKGPPSPTSAVG